MRFASFFTGGTTPGITRAGKALVVDANKEVDYLKVADLEADSVDPTELSINGDTIEATAEELNRIADVNNRVVLAIANVVIDLADHEGRTLVADKDDGITFTLPASDGGGSRYRIVIGTTLASGSLVIGASGADLMKGLVFVLSDGSNAVLAFAAAADSNTITLNRTTSGTGAAGQWFEFEDIAEGVWAVRGAIAATGSEETPFSAV